VLEVHLDDGPVRALIQDDAKHERRVLVEHPAIGPEIVTKAETHPLSDVFVTQRLLLRIASVFGLDSAADMLPVLAHGSRTAETATSPKRLAYRRAFEEMRAIAKNLESLDRSLMRPTRPNWLLVASIVGGSAFGATILALLAPRFAGVILGLTMLGLLVYLTRIGLASLREIERKKGLPNEMVELQAALEAARERVGELADTLRRRGEDPDELLDGLVPPNLEHRAPSVLARTSVSSAELLALETVGAQALIFVPAHNVGGDDFGGRVRRPEGLSSDLAKLGGTDGE
jgi:hypothetical protein